MAMIETTRRAPFGAITVHRIVAAFERVMMRVREALAAARTARELEKLSPRMREDIGLAEADIQAYREKAILV